MTDPEIQEIVRLVGQAIESGRADAELESIREAQREFREALARCDRIDPEKLRKRIGPLPRV